jgi:hypothetical protein
MTRCALRKVLERRCCIPLTRNTVGTSRMTALAPVAREKGRYIHNTLYVSFLSRSVRSYIYMGDGFSFPFRALYGFIVLL